MKIRTGDQVIVIAWKNKGEKSKVVKVLTRTHRVIVEGVNMVTRNYKKMWTQAGGSIQKENPIDVSNVMLICPFTSKPTRVWFIIIEDKSWRKKFRFSKTALKTKWGEAKDYIIK